MSSSLGPDLQSQANMSEAVSDKLVNSIIRESIKCLKPMVGFLISVIEACWLTCEHVEILVQQISLSK